MPYLQPRLFDDLPPTREETPVHQLNYPTFAGAENTMWHGRSYYPRKNAPGLGGWDPAGSDPVHVGTFEAAAHRGLGEHRARPSMRNPGGVSSVDHETYRSRPEIMETAGTERGTQMLPFRINEGSMANTPGMPVSDAHANMAVGNYDEYQEEYVEELQQAGIAPDNLFDGEFEDQIADHLPDPIEQSGGLYYRNRHEDPGSISAVVPQASDLQHWPTEVLKHSTNPAQIRTAEFLRGRGY